MPINIKRAVIHILDRDSDNPLLNDFLLEIDEDIENFLQKHISKALNDDGIRQALFNEGMNIVREACYRMGEEEDFFLEGSKEIARQLFKSMKTNSSISSTDLIVCSYDDENSSNIAILKMDYNTTFIHEVEVVDGRFKIAIRKQDISLPGTGQRIQKCAFVKSLPQNGDNDLLVLDNQINGSQKEEPVAQFFLQTFLGARLILDNKTCTRLFKKESENWLREKQKEGEPELEKIRDLINESIINEESINIEEFSREAFGGKQELRSEFINNLAGKGLQIPEFEVDRKWVENKLSRLRLRTDTKIDIYIDYENYQNSDIFEIIENFDGTKTIVIKNISYIHEK